MRKQYSFLSPENINYLILRLRNIFPQNRHDQIREETPSLAKYWFDSSAHMVEEQFVDGTQALNEEFFRFIIQTKQFMPTEIEILPSYSSECADPYVPNQPFQNINNDIMYDSQAMDYDVTNMPYFRGINKELDEADIGGVPLRGNMLKTKMAQLATEISRNRVRQTTNRPLTWGVQRQCEDNFTTCEHPALPRKKFTLGRDYYTSSTASAYWTGVESCSMKRFTRQGYDPTEGDCTNARMSQLYHENMYKFPNYSSYRKDFIPSVWRNH
jgi:hypothetical protein